MSCLLQIRLLPKLLRGKLLRSSRGDVSTSPSILQRFGSLHRRFLNSLVWPEAAGLASVDVGTSMLGGCRWCLCLGFPLWIHGNRIFTYIYQVNIRCMDPMVYFSTKRSEERGGWGKTWMALLFLGWKVCKIDLFHCINWKFAAVLLLQIQLSCDCLVSTAFFHFFHQWFSRCFFLETNDASTACKRAPCCTSSKGGGSAIYESIPSLEKYSSRNPLPRTYRDSYGYVFYMFVSCCNSKLFAVVNIWGYLHICFVHLLLVCMVLHLFFQVANKMKWSWQWLQLYFVKFIDSKI